MDMAKWLSLGDETEVGTPDGAVALLDRVLVDASGWR
jgi:hypothetical protein